MFSHMNVPLKRRPGTRLDFSHAQSPRASINVEPLRVSAHLGMNDFITSPKHGDSGWCGRELYIYNAVHGLPGWLKLEQYQKRKAEITGKRDWRISEVPKDSFEEKARKNRFSYDSTRDYEFR